MKRSFPIYSVFLAGLILLFFSVIARIEHWSFHQAMFWIGCASEILFFIFLFIEIATSKKADVSTKAFWLTAYILLLVACCFVYPEMGMMILVAVGTLYLVWARGLFISKTAK